MTAGRSSKNRTGRFGTVELVFLALIVIAFIAGTIVMASRGFKTGAAGSGSGTGPAVLHRIERMLVIAKKIDGKLGQPSNSLRFWADVDDDTSTGYDLPEGKGLELVEISREKTTGTRLVARVSTGKSIRKVVMLDDLDRQLSSFVALLEPPKEPPRTGAGRAGLTVRVREGGTVRESTMTFNLTFAPVVTAHGTGPF